MENFLTSDAIRTLFSQAMSSMYQQEVPQYGTLTQLVTAVNECTLEAQPALKTASLPPMNWTDSAWNVTVRFVWGLPKNSARCARCLR